MVRMQPDTEAGADPSFPVANWHVAPPPVAEPSEAVPAIAASTI